MEKGNSGEVYNVGGDEQITVRALFFMVKKATGLTGEADFRDHFIEDHRGRWPDTTKLRALGWRPNIPLEAGIRHSYQDLLHSLGIKPAAFGPARRKDGGAPLVGDRSQPASP
jgi:nucleoside-diphosphate-sugar epimerase